MCQQALRLVVGVCLNYVRGLCQQYRVICTLNTGEQHVNSNGIPESDPFDRYKG